MQVLRSLAEVDAWAGRSVVTVGNFDGVHRGHQMVIAHVLDRAQELHARAIAVTFDPHPARVLRPERELRLITPLEEKLKLLAATGIGTTLVLPFHECRVWTAREFAERVLRDALNAVEVHEGETFRFGVGAEAGIEGLEALGFENSFAVRAWTPLTVRGAAISSSRVRGVIAAGAMSEARALLGRAFSVKSRPASGRGYGTKYAVPTVNLAPYADLLPGHGVYVTTLRVGAERVFRGVTNVGVRPTFGEDSFAVETHLFDWEPMDLSESTELEMTFLKRLRGERKFDSLEELRAQIGRDVARAGRYFGLCDLLVRE